MKISLIGVPHLNFLDGDCPGVSEVSEMSVSDASRLEETPLNLTPQPAT